MSSQLIIAIAVAVTAVVAAVAMALTTYFREKRQADREDAVAKAAQEYLSRFEIPARIVAASLANNCIVLMVEAPPHKKLRFSIIIEQPIKQFVLKQTGVDVDRMFWRFPMPAKNSQASDVKYGEPSTIIPSSQAVITPASTPSESESQAITQDHEDDYFQSRSYQIEEISWEDFSTVAKPNADKKQL